MAESIVLANKNTVDLVLKKINDLQDNGDLQLPKSYSAANALKSAWLILQSTVDKNSRPVLQVCTGDSVANALFDMAVQGLNPVKKQGYFIAYGSQLSFLRSYFGTMAATKNATGVTDIFAEVVYLGDDFEFEIVRGKKKVTKHTQSVANIERGEIVGAYCTIVDAADREFTEFMTIKEIKKSWAQSKMNPNAENSTHNKFPQEMCKRTVINRACKTFLNSSDDSNLMIAHIKRADDEMSRREIEQEIEDNANTQTIDANFRDIDDDEQAVPVEPQPAGGAPF